MSALGGFFNLPSLLALEQNRRNHDRPGQAKSVIVLYLLGGAPTQGPGGRVTAGLTAVQVVASTGFATLTSISATFLGVVALALCAIAVGTEYGNGTLRNLIVQGFANAVDLAVAQVTLEDTWPDELSIGDSVFFDNDKVGVEARMAFCAERLKASIGDGRATCTSVMRPSLCTLNVTTTRPCIVIAA